MLDQATKDLANRWFNAARQGDINVLQQLLDEGIDINWRLMTFEEGELDDFISFRTTALMVATRYDQIDCMIFLINHGAAINELDARASPPLLYARSARATQILLENGADANYIEINDMTPLKHAVAFEDLACIELLLSYGADVNASDDIGRTAYNFIQGLNNDAMRVMLDSAKDRLENILK